MLGNTLKTWEPFENMLGTHWEQGRKTKNNSPTSPHPEKEKTGPIVSVCWAFPLAACNFYFQNCLSPFFWPGLMVGAEIWSHREHIGNLIGTHWELERNMLGTKEKWKIILPPPPKLKEKKNQGTLSAYGAFPLAAWNFYSQNCLSPFLAWANTLNINWGYLILIH
jgi:hypothetical protein